MLQGDRFVYCSQAWQRVAALIAMRIPITCPPVTAATFRPQWMAGKKVLIFKLHGYPDHPDWFGLDNQGERHEALTPALVECADLTGAIVIALVCYSLRSPMSAAFFRAGAKAFFGAPGELRARETKPGEADNLAIHLLRTLRSAPLDQALALAKERFGQKPDLSEHDRYTLDTFGGSYAV